VQSPTRIAARLLCVPPKHAVFQGTTATHRCWRPAVTGPARKSPSARGAPASLAPQGDRKRANRLFKQGETSLLLLGSNPTPQSPFRQQRPPSRAAATAEHALLCRTENSALGRCCRHGVRLSRLYISRRHAPTHRCAGARLAMCRDFDRLPFRPLGLGTRACAPLRLFQSGLKIDSLAAHCDCSETFPHIG